MKFVVNDQGCALKIDTLAFGLRVDSGYPVDGGKHDLSCVFISGNESIVIVSIYSDFMLKRQPTVA